jgi:hypothetical protein
MNNRHCRLTQFIRTNLQLLQAEAQMNKNIAFASVIASSIALGAGTSSTYAGGDKQWEGLYGGFATTIAAASSPKDNLGSKLGNKTGAGAGIVLGYNYVSDNFLLGFEIDTLAISMNLKANNVPLSKAVDINSVSTARVRAGMLFGDERDYLLYATGGLAVTGVETSITTLGSTVNDDRYVMGFAAGGGIETWLFGNGWISTKLEYLYTSVPSKSYASGMVPAALAAAPTTPYRFKTGIHHLRSSWNVHF